MKRVPEAERMDTAPAADAYAVADFADVNRAFVEAVVGAIGPTGPRRILDLGSGPGDIPIALAAELPDVRMVGVDAAAEMLTWAARRPVSNGVAGCVAFVRGDAKRLPFPTGSFDAVISNSILHHVADPVAFWFEVARVSREGASIFMRDLYRPESLEAAHALVDEHARDESEMLRGEFYRSLCAAYTVEEVCEQLRDANLSALRVSVSSGRHLDVIGRAY